MKAFRVIIKGRVTGVGFRYSAVNKAAELDGISGFIMNTGYGEVEAFVQGPETSLNEMLLFFHHGPSFARVDSVNISEAQVKSGLTGFSIKG